VASTVFVSYSHHDRAWIREMLIGRLDSWGVNVLVDFRTLRPGESLGTAIQEAIQAADHVIFVISRAFVTSEWTRRELQETLVNDPAAIRRKAIPVVLDEAAVPDEIKSIVWCNLSGLADVEDEWWKLCDAVKGNWIAGVHGASRGVELAPERSKDLNALKNLSADSQSPRMRASIIRRVARIGKHDEIDWLAEIIWTSKYGGSRREAIVQLGTMGGDHALEILKEIAEYHRSSESRAQALEQLAEVMEATDTRWIIPILQREDHWNVRYRLVVAVTHLLFRDAGRAPVAAQMLPESDLLELVDLAESEKQPDVRLRLVAIAAYFGKQEPRIKQWVTNMAVSSESDYYREHCYAVGLYIWRDDPEFTSALRESPEGDWRHIGKTFLRWVEEGDWQRFAFHAGLSRSSP
jgi:hypothetical protein